METFNFKLFCLIIFIFFSFFPLCAGLEFKKELGKEMENEYRCLWDTVTKLAAKYSFGDAFPIRKTSQLFLEQEQTLFRGTDNSTN